MFFKFIEILFAHRLRLIVSVVLVNVIFSGIGYNFIYAFPEIFRFHNFAAAYFSEICDFVIRTYNLQFFIISESFDLFSDDIICSYIFRMYYFSFFKTAICSASDTSPSVQLASPNEQTATGFIPL